MGLLCVVYKGIHIGILVQHYHCIHYWKEIRMYSSNKLLKRVKLERWISLPNNGKLGLFFKKKSKREMKCTKLEQKQVNEIVCVDGWTIYLVTCRNNNLQSRSVHVNITYTNTYIQQKLETLEVVFLSDKTSSFHLKKEAWYIGQKAEYSL